MNVTPCYYSYQNNVVFHLIVASMPLLIMMNDDVIK